MGYEDERPWVCIETWWYSLLLDGFFVILIVLVVHKNYIWRLVQVVVELLFHINLAMDGGNDLGLGWWGWVLHPKFPFFSHFDIWTEFLQFKTAKTTHQLNDQAIMCHLGHFEKLVCLFDNLPIFVYQNDLCLISLYWQLYN